MRRAAAVVVGVLALATGVAHADEAADLAAFAKVGPGCEKARTHCFGIQLHVAKKGDKPDDGFVVTPEWVADQLAMAQKHFGALDVGFEIVGADALPSSAAHLVTRKDRDAIAVGRLGGRVVHVSFTGMLDDVDIKDNVVYGVTWRAGSRKYIIVSGMAWPRTLAHELGHFFGLPHSTYAISIMNKNERKDPPPEQRTFADEEVAAMKPVLKQLVRDKVIAERPRS